MSDKQILVEYNPFCAESKISTIGCENNYTCRVDNNDIDILCKEIVALAYGEGIYEVAVTGPFAFTSELIRTVQQEESRTYAENNITIRGI